MRENLILMAVMFGAFAAVCMIGIGGAMVVSAAGQLVHATVLTVGGR